MTLICKFVIKQLACFVILSQMNLTISKKLAADYINSVAFESEAWVFFHALKDSACNVVDLVVRAAERLIHDIKTNGNNSGKRSMDMHELQEIIRDEYAMSETSPDLRQRLLDIIDGMLSLEMYGVEEIIGAHER